MSEDYLSDFNKPCPHRRSVLRCNDCFNDYCKAEDLLEGATDVDQPIPDPDPWQRTRAAVRRP